MKRWAAVGLVTLMIGIMGSVPAAAAPYVSCRDGHIVPTLEMCPPYPRPVIGVHPGAGGGAGRGGGLLGTIGRILGGLTGGLL